MSLLLRRPPGREAYPGDIGGLSIPSKKNKIVIKVNTILNPHIKTTLKIRLGDELSK